MKRFIVFLIITVGLGCIGYFLIDYISNQNGKVGDAPRVVATKWVPPSTSAFDDASIAFQAPKFLRVGKSKDVKLVLSLEKTVEELRAQLDKEFPNQGASIQSSPIMEASLSCGAFTITDSTPKRQAIRENEDTTWSWAVVPRERGKHLLTLRLYAIVSMDGISAPLEVKTFQREIPVEVSFPELVWSLIKANLHFVWLIIVIPIAGYLSRFFRKKSGGTTP